MATERDKSEYSLKHGLSIAITISSSSDLPDGLFYCPYGKLAYLLPTCKVFVAGPLFNQTISSNLKPDRMKKQQATATGFLFECRKNSMARMRTV
jgi:hypothetical protein